MLQADEAVTACQQAHLLHGEEVVVHRRGPLLKDRRKLMLARRDFVVLGLCGNAQFPQLVVKLFHELADGGTDGTKIVLLKLLALCRRAAKERAPREDEVRTGLIVLLANEEVLLLGTDSGEDTLWFATKQGKHALGLYLKGVLRAQQRCLLVECLTGVGDERGGNAEHLVLDEGGAHGIPYGVSAGLEGGPEASRGER